MSEAAEHYYRAGTPLLLHIIRRSSPASLLFSRDQPEQTNAHARSPNQASDSLVRNLLDVFILAAGFLGSVAPLPKAWSPIEWVRGSGKLRRNSHPAFLGHRAQEPSTIACDLPRFANSRRAGHRLGGQGAWRLQRCGCTDRFVPGASDQYPCRDDGCFGATVPSRATLAAVLRSERPAKTGGRRYGG